MSMDEKRLGQRLQAARQAAGFTQQMLCQKAGLSYSTLAKIERGAIKTPSVFTIQSIAGALGTTLDELVGAPAQPTKQRRRSKSGVNFVYFDVNGCLVRFYFQAFTEVAAAADIAVDVVETAFWHYNDQVCRGHISLEEFNVAMAKRLHMDQFDWMEYYFRAVKAMPGMHTFVEWAARRYGVGLLTNIMPSQLGMMRERGLIPNVAFDSVIDSSVVHLLKPERAIYELASAKANCPAEEILFVDDSRANLMAAEKIGWHVMWFDDSHPEESIARLRQALEPAD
jgi:HAD superfamily hydrolase (TIGR01509 family)